MMSVYVCGRRKRGYDKTPGAKREDRPDDCLHPIRKRPAPDFPKP